MTAFAAVWMQIEGEDKMKGTLVNVATVLVGSGIGLMLKRGIPEKYQTTIMQGVALAVGLVGLQMAVKTENILIVIISLVIGAIIGESLDIDGWLNRVGEKLSERLGSQYGNVGQGFVTASLVFCVGAMAVVGSIQDGLTGDASTLYVKATLDGITAIVFASSMGIGVAFSSIPILIYQGALTLLAMGFGNILSASAVNEMTAVGGLLIVGICLLMLEMKTIKVANFLPAIPLAAVIAAVWPI
ncbi:putative membrane protein YdfK [bioreactor metagenome]|uniref:Putative membrane protein YdfK n=1 Tax=bioreactor metagenome TaxID=1076179 RepID=A0A644SVQ1_9ZZZZ